MQFLLRESVWSIQNNTEAVWNHIHLFSFDGNNYEPMGEDIIHPEKYHEYIIKFVLIMYVNRDKNWNFNVVGYCNKLCPEMGN
jgi:hypothetical protein